MLRRSLGPIQIQLVSLGGIIGSGYFLGVGSTLSENGVATILAYLLGGLIVWMVAMAMGELCVGMAREGSFVSHAAELVGPHWAAGVGWSYWLNWCAYIPSEMVAGGLILHEFFPQTSVLVWATVFGVAITCFNLLNVRYFGHIESGLALFKIAAMAGFSFVAFKVCAGWGVPALVRNVSSAASFKLPTGVFPFLATMVPVLVNFQGTELIALSAAETKNPERSIPRAARNVALRTITLYVIPLSLLILVFPLGEVTVERSVFAEMLSRFGFSHSAIVFELMIVTAALSCANSGLFGAARSLYGLGKEGLAPKWLTKLNSQGVPAPATWLTIGVCWLFLPLLVFFESSTLYVWLLSVSGFTGAICWISITWCQIQLRRKIQKSGQPLSVLPYKMPAFPYLSWISLVLQVICVGVIALHPILRNSLVLGIPAFVVPMLVSMWIQKRGVKMTPHANLHIINT